jgi:hypothetical protein
MTDEELGRKIMVEAGLRLAHFHDSEIDRIGSAARTLLATQPDRNAENDRLTAEVARLREGLRTLINSCCSVPDTLMDAVVGPTYILYGIHLNKARAALEATDDTN